MPKVKKEDNVLYAGADEWVNTRTGQVITANQIIKKTDRNGKATLQIKRRQDNFRRLRRTSGVFQHRREHSPYLCSAYRLCRRCRSYRIYCGCNASA